MECKIWTAASERLWKLSKPNYYGWEDARRNVREGHAYSCRVGDIDRQANIKVLSACMEYVKGLETAYGANYLPALQELVNLKACSRCCLRFAGIRSSLYSVPAPTASQLYTLYKDAPSQAGDTPRASSSQGKLKPLNGHTYLSEGKSRSTIQDTLTQQTVSLTDDEGQSAGAEKLVQASLKLSPHNQDAKNSASAAESLVSQGTVDPKSDTAMGAKTSLQTDLLQENSKDTAEPTCSVCLGVLQSLDRSVSEVSEELCNALSESDGAGTSWFPLLTGTPAAIAKHIRDLNYCVDSFALELSIPASTQLRQLSMWHHLRSLEETKSLYTGETLRDDAVDLKETLRLRGCLAEPLSQELGKDLDPQDGQLRVTLSYLHPSSASESDFLFGRPFRGRSQKKRRKKTHVIDVGRTASEQIAQGAAKYASDKFREAVDVPPKQWDTPIHIMVACRRTPVYIGGRYRKLQRDVSQTPWTIDGQRKGRTSVQEEIEKVLLPELRCDGSKFITAGREDIDVRMLGTGRPFIMEVQNMRAAIPNTDFFTAVEEHLKQSNVGVEVQDLKAASKDKLQQIKAGEESKQKSYRAICELPEDVTAEHLEKINNTRDLLLAQNTPTRVAHRRALLVRERMVYTMHAERVPENPKQLVLELRTQAGTYIKEFVHSDDGRTVPNLGSHLGCAEPAKILQLDVLEVHMEF